MTKYYNYDIVFQEIPDEVTLAVNLSNCPNHCDGCHSPHLCKDIGIELNEATIDELIFKYKNGITCFCFMGGDANQDEIIKLASYIKANYNIKVALYSGKSNLPKIIDPFQYIKIGPYIPQKGGLKSKNTNQRLYQIINNKTVDITNRFWKTAV